MTTISHEDLPDWPIELALESVNTPSHLPWTVGDIRNFRWYASIPLFRSVLAHAALIFTHQEKPVDPLIAEAREICAKDAERWGLHEAARRHRAGEGDNTVMMPLILATLRRGVEIGKGGA